MDEDTERHGLPSPDQVISALDRTGFILEYRVAQKLRQAKFETFLNQPFTDPETGKSRETDILAVLDIPIEAKGFKVILAVRIIAECKRFELPLAIIGEERVVHHNDEPLVPFEPLEYDFPKLAAMSVRQLRVYLNLWRFASHSTRGFIGSQLIRMNRSGGKWQANNNSIYDSIIYPLAKAAKQERAEIQEGAFGSGDDDESAQRLIPSIFYTFPILVTSSDLYTVDVTSEDKPTVTVAAWAPLVRHFNDGLFLMDVVNFDHISDYLRQRVHPVIEDAMSALSPNVHVFDPEWLMAQYGKPADPTFDKWLSEFKAEYRSSSEDSAGE